MQSNYFIYRMKRTLTILCGLICICNLHLFAGLDVSEYNVPSGDATIFVKVYGKGEPLVLLHGAMVDMNDWENQVSVLALKYKVITIDSRGHGRSTYTDIPMTYQLMSEDVLNVLDYLKLDSVSIIGFSDGGIIGMQLAMNHPERVIKLVAIGVNLTATPDVVYPYFLDKVKDWDLVKMEKLLKERYKNYPNPELLGSFIRRMQYMLLHEPNWSMQNMKSIVCPTLIMVSDYDLVTVKHSFDIFENLPKAYLAVIPGAKHYNIKEKPAIVNSILLDFIGKPFEKIDRY